MNRFEGKVCLITGGAQGIGRAIGEAFHLEGASVSFMDIDKAAGIELSERLKASLFVRGDAALGENLEAFVQKSVDRFRQVDFLINNACVGAGGILSDCDGEAFDRCLAIGLKAPYLLSRLCLPYFAHDNSSCIVNIASTRAIMSEPDTEAYSAAKGGIIALTHALAVSLGPRIRVNAVSPGWIETGHHRKEGQTKMIQHKESDQKQHPAGRIGTPEDIAAAVLFLCSPEASFITGQNLPVDGGMTKRMVYSGDWGWEYTPSK